MTEASKLTPDVAKETSVALGDKRDAEVEDILIQKFGEHLEDGEKFATALFIGPNEREPTAAFFRCAVGKPSRPHVFEFFARDVPGKYPAGAAGAVVSFAVYALSEYFGADRDAYFNIDFVGHPVDDNVIFARSQVRDLEAERLADEWLEANS